MWRKLTIPVLLAVFLAVPLNSARANSYFDIKIKLDKKTYVVGESLKGEVVIQNQYPATVPATFEMKLYHNGHLRHTAQVYVKTFPTGDLPFSFETFQIPVRTFNPADRGSWEIMIKQINEPPESAGRAQFEVVAVNHTAPAKR